MASATVIFHRLAAKEYLLARRWYARRSVAAAERFRVAINQTIQQIAAAPQRGAKYQGKYRWVRTRRFPYIVYYEIVSPAEVKIMAVAHGRRRPGYWRRRSGA